MSIGELRTLLRETPEKLPDEPQTGEYAKATARAVEKALEELAVEHDAADRSYRLACVGGNWQFVTKPDFAPWLQVLVGAKPRPPKLSHPALETLAIIAYRQPITRAEIEQIRGVAVDGVVQTLVERELIEACGEADAPGRPRLYGTTQFFLEGQLQSSVPNFIPNTISSKILTKRTTIHVFCPNLAPNVTKQQVAHSC